MVGAVVSMGEMAEAERWDSESYQPELRRSEQAIGAATRLGGAARITHPAEIPRVYTDDESGVPFLLAANIRPILPNFGSLQRIPTEVARKLPTNRLQYEDVPVMRTGANHGVACVYLEKSEAYYTSGEGLIVRPDPGVDGAYLGAFLGSRHGHQLCLKAAYGSGQPHIAPPYLRKLPVLRMGKREAAIGDLVRDAWDSGRNALPFYAEAQAEMMKSLGWSGFVRPSSRPSYVADYQTLVRAGRWDADFFSPDAPALMGFLFRDRQVIGDVAPLMRRPFSPEPEKTFSYIEISDVDRIGRLASSPVAGEDAPDRAKWLVRTGDVLTSTVRPIRRLTGVVAGAQAGSVSSNGFAVLCPQAVEPEVLLVYLRLPPVCELLNIFTTGSMYPAIAHADVPRIPIILPPKKSRDRIVAKVRDAWNAQSRADAKLDEAKGAIEQEMEKRLK